MKHYQNLKNKQTKTILSLLLIAGLFFINLMNAEGAGCKAAFTYTVSGRTVTVTNKSTSTLRDSTYKYFQPNGYADVQDTVIKYWHNGTYKLTMHIYYRNDTTYCTDTVSQFVTVSDINAGFTIQDSLSKIIGYISLSPNDWSGTNLKNHWDFGDGDSSTERWVDHQYKKSGTYTVCFKVEDTIYHLKDSLCKTISVVVNPCHATIYDTAILKNAMFTSQGLHMPDYKKLFPNAKYFWDFGDGNSDTGLKVYHHYSKGGNYTVKLIMINGTDTCKASKSVTIIGCNASWGSYADGLKTHFSLYIKTTTASYHWDFGDGDTITATDPTHIYKVAGSYTVKMVATDGADVCDYSRTIHTGRVDIWGKVLLGVDSTECARVWLIKFNTKDSSLMAVDSYDISGWHVFNFRYKDPGTYLIKAALRSCDSFYKSYLPTYSDSSLRWDSARFLPVDTNSFYANIYLRKGNNPGGPGFIAGKVKAGANKKEGDPMSHVEILLLDMKDNPVAYTYSLPNGSFEFKNIPYGTYKVYAEVLGLPTNPSIITINAGHPVDTNSIVIINTTSVVTGIQHVSVSSQAKDVKIFPNPASDILNISLPPNSLGQCKVSITDLTGRAMLQTQFDGGNTNKQIDLKSIIPGIYIISVDSGDGNLFKSRLVIQP